MEIQWPICVLFALAFIAGLSAGLSYGFFRSARIMREFRRELEEMEFFANRSR